MLGTEQISRRRILGVFAHPDDETSTCAGTFTKYAREGVEIYVATATRGEMGELGTGGLKLRREDLPAAREDELRTVLKLYGAKPPILLGYRDQELVSADFEEVVQKVVAVMEDVRPDIVITFGPTGISQHEDHIAIHKAAAEAFHRYRKTVEPEPRLLYVALTEEIASQFDMDLDETEMAPSIVIDITDFKSVKIQGLRLYRSQQDAQELADMFESSPFNLEWFHQAYPPAKRDEMATELWA